MDSTRPESNASPSAGGNKARGDSAVAAVAGEAGISDPADTEPHCDAPGSASADAFSESSDGTAYPSEPCTADASASGPSAVADNPDPDNRILLHACCGPCSLEPSRLLGEEGFDITVYYANSNIEPADEYAHRLDTLEQWAREEDLPVIAGPYDNAAWREAVAERQFEAREERCRACYRIRFEEAARYAAEHGYPTIGTTLSVSPYQHTDIIREELERAARLAGVQARFEDYRPYYDEATHRSREMGMYRQNYCGCALSAGEAARERAERKAARKAAREAQAKAHAEERAAEEAMRAETRAAKQDYAAKQARKKQILRELRKQSDDR